MAPPKRWITTTLKTNAKEIVLPKNKNIMNVYNHIRFIMTLGYSSVTSNMILPVDGRANESNSHFTNSFGSIVGGVSGCGGAGGSAAALAAKPGYNIMQKGGKRRSKGGVSGNGSGYNGMQLTGGSKRSNKCSKRSNKRTKRSNKGGGYASPAVNLQAWQGQALKVKGGSNKRNKRTKRSNKGGGHAPQAVNLAIDTWPGGSNKRNKRSKRGGYASNISGYDLKVKGGSNKRNKRSKRGGLSAMSPASFSGAANAPYHQFMGSQPVSFNYGLGVNAPIPPSDSWMASPPPMNNIHNNCGPNNGLIPLIK
jgi:hypothetical protein